MAAGKNWEGFPEEAEFWLKRGKEYEDFGEDMRAASSYQKGLAILLQAKEASNSEPELLSDIRNRAPEYIRSLNSCIARASSSFRPNNKLSKSSSSSLSSSTGCPNEGIPCGQHCNQIFRDHHHRRNHLLRVEKTKNFRAQKILGKREDEVRVLPMTLPARSSLKRKKREDRKRPLKIKPPLCDEDHEHIFFSETFKTLEAAHQYMIDSGLRTLYRTRSSNTVGAIYVCKRTKKDYECKKKKKDIDCGVTIKISTKLISRKAGDRFFIVKGCLNHNHEIKDARLSPKILKLIDKSSFNSRAEEVVIDPSVLPKQETERAIESITMEEIAPAQSNEVIVEYDSDGGGHRTEIYVPVMSDDIDKYISFDTPPQYVQEVTLDHAYSVEEEVSAKKSLKSVQPLSPLQNEIKEEIVYQVFSCDSCSKVFFDEESLKFHECLESDSESCVPHCSDLDHVHQFIDRDFISMESALEYVKSQDLHVYFLEQMKRKDFVVYQCSKGVHPDRVTVKNELCPATFTVKASKSKYSIKGCLTHNHDTEPQLLRHLTKAFKKTHFAENSFFENETEGFAAKKEHAVTLLLGTIKYIKGLKYSLSSDKTLNAVIKGAVNAVNPRMLMGNLDKKKTTV